MTLTYTTSGQAHHDDQVRWRAMDSAVEAPPSLHFVMVWPTAAMWVLLLAEWAKWYNAEYDKMQIKLGAAKKQRQAEWDTMRSVS